MIILDTNVLSALMGKVADEEVISWLDQQPRPSIWTTSITLLEVWFGLYVMPLGNRRASLMRAFEVALSDKIERRIASFDAAAAQQAADLLALRHKRGPPRDLRDTMIAGIVLARQATLATRNTTHFSVLSAPVINPWASSD
jgi:toxin FitB